MHATEHLSETQITALKEAFSLFDADDDGQMTITELGEVMRSLGENPTDSQLREMIREVDADGDGSISLDEFLAMMASEMAGADFDDDLKKAFAIFDQDGNGFISRDELREVLISLGEEATEEKLDRMIAKVDLNGDGQVDFEEFKLLMLGQ